MFQPDSTVFIFSTNQFFLSELLLIFTFCVIYLFNSCSHPSLTSFHTFAPASSSPAIPPPFTSIHAKTYIPFPLSLPLSLSPSLFSFLSPSVQPFNVKGIKELSWNDKCFIRPHSLFFWRVNTKRKWRRSSYHCLPLDFISISISLLSTSSVTSHLHSSLLASLLSSSLSISLPHPVVLETSSFTLAS